MKLFTAHKVSTTFLWLYLIWWGWVVYYYFYQPMPAVKVCDFMPLLMIVFSPLLGMAYTFAFMIKYFSSHKSVQDDYLIFTGLVQFPLLIAAGIFISR
jgi:hypothetical protein